jgi:hypothetical protein
MVIHVVSFADLVRVAVASQPAAITTLSYIHANAHGYKHSRRSRFIFRKQIWIPEEFFARNLMRHRLGGGST